MNIQLFRPKGTFFFRLYDFIILSFKIFILLSCFGSTTPKSWNDTEQICMTPAQGYILSLLHLSRFLGRSWRLLKRRKQFSFFFSLGKSGDSANLGHNSGSFQLDAEKDATKLCWWLECFSVLSLETVEPTGLGCHITDRTNQRDNCSTHQLGFQAF